MADIKRYLNLITSEHSDKPNFRSVITALLNEIDFEVDIDNAFDLDNAVGTQLDIIGSIVGLSRYLTFQPSNGISPVLDDSNYRSLLKAKIILNQWDGQLESLTDALLNWNPDVFFQIKDNQNMSLDVVAVGLNDFQKELIANGYIVPKPGGIKINYTISNVPVFAYDSSTTAIGGYGIGTWL